MVLIQTDYTAWRTGAVSKYVCCEKCGTEFAYTMIRQGTGQGTSLYFLDESGAAKRAERRAESNLQNALANEVEPVECPGCGCFQADMVREARRRYLHFMGPWYSIVALVVLTPIFFCGTGYINGVAAASLIVPWPWIWYATAGLAVVIIAMPFLRYALALGHDPNRLTMEQRAARGYGLGLRAQDYERMMALAKGMPAPAPDPAPDSAAEPTQVVTDVTFNGTSLGQLFGKDLQSTEMQDFSKSIPEVAEEARFEPSVYWLWKRHGLSFEFQRGKLVFILLYPEGVEGFNLFRGALPMSLAFSDTRADVERKLGKPTELDTLGGALPVSAWYRSRGIKISYASKDLHDLANRIQHVGIFPVPASAVGIVAAP